MLLCFQNHHIRGAEEDVTASARMVLALFFSKSDAFMFDLHASVKFHPNWYHIGLCSRRIADDVWRGLMPTLAQHAGIMGRYISISQSWKMDPITSQKQCALKAKRFWSIVEIHIMNQMYAVASACRLKEAKWVQVRTGNMRSDDVFRVWGGQRPSLNRNFQNLHEGYFQPDPKFQQVSCQNSPANCYWKPYETVTLPWVSRDCCSCWWTRCLWFNQTQIAPWPHHATSGWTGGAHLPTGRSSRSRGRGEESKRHLVTTVAE